MLQQTNSTPSIDLHSVSLNINLSKNFSFWRFIFTWGMDFFYLSFWQKEKMVKEQEEKSLENGNLNMLNTAQL